jgi:TolB protein
MARVWGLIAAAGLMAATRTTAQVEIVKPGTERTSLSLTEFTAAGGNSAQVFRRTLEEDLKRSGCFSLVAGQASLMIQGSCGDAGGTVTAGCRVQNRAQGKEVFRKSYRGEAAGARRLAHAAADDIVLALTGKRGIAGTRIAMVGLRGGRKDLYVCDADGGNLTQISRDGAPCLSPAWSRDSQALYYMSMHRGFPDVYRVDLGSHRRSPVATYPGLNMSPAVSPDGRRLALVLSKDGNPDLYVMDLGTRQLTRVTRSRQAAEASPSWSPDGSQIVYVSDRAGSPHLYVVAASGGTERRLTVRGRQNVGPEWGANGLIVYSSLRDQCYQICVADAGGEKDQLTKDYADHEDPSWAPDGRHIVYARSAGHRSGLYVIDSEDRSEVGLPLTEGSWYSPAWSPR